MCCSRAGGWGSRHAVLEHGVSARWDPLSFHFPNALAESQESLNILGTSLLQSSTPKAEIPNTAGDWLDRDLEIQAPQQCIGSALAVYLFVSI